MLTARLQSNFLSRKVVVAKETRRKSSSPTLSLARADLSELAGVLLFSAFPFTAVKALASSPLGEALRQRLQKEKAAFERQAAARLAAAQRAKYSSPWYGDARPKWLGPLSFEYPTHLRGDAPADYGFDVLRLAEREANFERYFNLEILHARWAMLGALGVLVPEVLAMMGQFGSLEPVWWKVGAAKLQGDNLDYLGIDGLHVAGGQGVIIIAVCQFLLMLGPEYARATGIQALEPLGIFLPGDINYPGGFLFDPLGLASDPETLGDLKVKEMKNGRLAMVAWVGFALQAAFTHQGPVKNLFDHLGDPWKDNIVAYVNVI